MAPADTVGPQGTSPSRPNQSSSEQPKSSQVDDKPREAQPEAAQNQSTDRSTTKFLQWAVNGSSELTDPATQEILRGAT